LPEDVEARNARVMQALTNKLTVEQQTHWRSILWLLSDINRGSGRTRLMAIALIYEALDRPGKHIYIFDHTHVSGVSSYRQSQMMTDTIYKLLSPFPELEVTFGSDGTWFSIAEGS
jgi:hypothetical protein